MKGGLVLALTLPLAPLPLRALLAFLAFLALRGRLYWSCAGLLLSTSITSFGATTRWTLTAASRAAEDA